MQRKKKKKEREREKEQHEKHNSIWSVSSNVSLGLPALISFPSGVEIWRLCRCFFPSQTYGEVYPHPL